MTEERLLGNHWKAIVKKKKKNKQPINPVPDNDTHLRKHETGINIVGRHLLGEKKKHWANQRDHVHYTMAQVDKFVRSQHNDHACYMYNASV